MRLLRNRSKCSMRTGSKSGFRFNDLKLGTGNLGTGNLVATKRRHRMKTKFIDEALNLPPHSFGIAPAHPVSFSAEAGVSSR